jgi:hypothetical protein
MTKSLHVEPCIWEGTLIRELLSVADEVVEHRPVFVVKDLPQLWIDSAYEGSVAAGTVATFTLVYGNEGGYESEATVAGAFPPEAPFRSSLPAPLYVSADRRSVSWSTGALHRDQVGHIQVSIAIASTAEPLSAIAVWNGIVNHGGGVEDEVWSDFSVGARVYLPLILRD